MKWIKRNEDKPHRCPECHAVADTGRKPFGPRSRAVCPVGCDVQWRMGSRFNRSSW